MRKMQLNICALAVLVATTLPVMATSTVDVRVIGTITPSACTPALSGGGTIDYGTINPNLLSASNYTLLPEKQIDFSIICDAPAKVGIKLINGRPNTMAGSTQSGPSGAEFPPAGVQFFGATGGWGAGLGLDGTDKIGGYGIRLQSSTVIADGNAVDTLRSDNAGASWNSVGRTGTGILYTSANRIISWAATSTLTPVAFTSLSGKLGVQAYLNFASELDLTKPISLDGLSTIELVYL